MENRIVVDKADKIGKIDPNIYGVFIENSLGRIVYDGIWVGENSQVPNYKGMRREVIDLAKELGPTVIRWPGGNFSSEYHWMDGVGPRTNRKTVYDLVWYQEESNEFGTDEFAEFCRLLGGNAYLNVNFGSGTAEEAARWVEYCNGEGNTYFAKMRVSNGYQKPHKVPYWGVGNEVFGNWQVGYTDAEDYAIRATEFVRLMRRVDPSIKVLLVGCDMRFPFGTEWNYKVLQVLRDEFSGAGAEDVWARQADYLTIHEYFFSVDYYTELASTVEAERDLNRIAGLIDSFALPRSPRVCVDEWNIWRREEAVSWAGKNYGLYEQKMMLQDALFAGCMLNTFQKLCNVVGMANFTSLVNSSGLIMTEKDGCYVTPSYHALKLYSTKCGEIAVKTRTECETYQAIEKSRQVHNYITKGWTVEKVPFLDVAATLNSGETKLSITVVNRHKTDDIESTIELRDCTPLSGGKVYELNGPDPTSVNSLSEPDKVKPIEKPLRIAGPKFDYRFPSHSLTLFEISLSL